TTVAEYLQDLNYTTAAFGKWHLGGEGYLPKDQGFEFALAGSRDGMPGSYYYPFSSKLFQLPELEKLGKKGDYLTDLLTDQAIDFLQEDHQQPFFLYLSYFAVHTPIQGKKELADKYRAAGDTSKYGAAYAAMVENLDRNVGRVLDVLSTESHDKNTLVVFTSDNGGLATSDPPVTTNAPLRGGKGSLYEGGIRVPLIIKHPQLTDTTVCHVPVILEDIFPTIIELTQGSDTQLGLLEFHGRSLLPLWKNTNLPDRSLFWHFPHYGNMAGSVPASAIRKGDYKLIRFYEDKRTELYNLERDPGETTNLVGEEPDLVVQLAEELSELKQKMKAQEPTPPGGK
ncbi:MAG: sulfatase, partial [Bacteroidota bacterium]